MPRVGLNPAKRSIQGHPHKTSKNLIGARIAAHAWELLLAMLIMDACFGLPGVIAAPIYYAYLKDELSARKLI